MSTSTPVLSADPEIYDDFNDHTFDGAYNRTLWSPSGDSFFEVEQQDGSLVFSNSTAPEAGGIVLGILRPRQRSLRQLRLFEARLKISSDHSGGYVFVKIQVSSDNIAGHGWWTQCRLGSWSSGERPDFICDVATSDETGVEFEHLTERVTVSYDTWHTARIEVDPDIANFRFYLNDTLVGSYTPTDASTLISSSNLRPQVGVWNDEADTYATRYVDDVRITHARP